MGLASVGHHRECYITTVLYRKVFYLLVWTDIFSGLGSEAMV